MSIQKSQFTDFSLRKEALGLEKLTKALEDQLQIGSYIGPLLIREKNIFTKKKRNNNNKTLQR